MAARSHSVRRGSSASSLARQLLGSHTRPLGKEAPDWHLRHFEVCPVVSELRYISNRKNSDPSTESRHAVGFKSLGFLQSTSTVKAIEKIELTDSNNEKFHLWPLEVSFFNLESTMAGERTFVIGCESMPEQLHWTKFIQKIIDNKESMSTERYQVWVAKRHSRKEDQALEHFNALRKGGGVSLEAHVNEEEFRKARIQNGKVFHDAEISFQNYSVETLGGVQVLEARVLVLVMHELGVDITSDQRDMLLADVFRQRDQQDDKMIKNPLEVDGCPVVTESEFELIFKTCFDNQTTEPSEAIKGKLLQIMSRSKNPFIQMLSNDEQRMLIDGRGPDGSPNCRFKTFEDGAVIVHQGDEGHSMFIVVEGQLSVVVTFGSGPTAQKKEVAVLPSGAVMGEMSLVLSKPRSATCVVKSATCDVAEITKGALENLMGARPYLQRELQEIVHRRDTANVLTGVGAKKKSNKLAEQSQSKDTAPAGGPRRGHRPSGEDTAATEVKSTASGAIVRFPRTSRVLTRNTKTIRPNTSLNARKNKDSKVAARSASANGSNPGEALPPLAPIVPVRSGCWVRCRDGYLLAWDLSPSI